jgi:hypothetical protein
LRIFAGGVVGAAIAGLLVGLTYGGLAAGKGAGSALSLVLVLVSVSLLAAMVSGLGIAGAIAIATGQAAPRWWRPVIGGGLGGLVIGGFASLLGLDTLRLLVGSAPERITGAGEGLIVGAATGASFVLSCRLKANALAQAVPAALLGGLGGLIIMLAGGTLMAGSLAALVARFPNAELTLAWASDSRWSAAAAIFEGALFTALVTAGMARGARASLR